MGKRKVQNWYLCQCSCGEFIERSTTRIINEKHAHTGCKNLINKKHFNLKYGPEEASFRGKATNYKAIAKSRNHEFSLTMDETIDLLKRNCYYCGGLPNNVFNAILRNRRDKSQYNFYEIKEYDIKYNGIDRINSSLGYTIDNVVSCCKHCNTAKLDRTYDEFKSWIERVYNNLHKTII